eukprot:ANDGO_03058.mRNA.2 hypothetical protein
MLRANRALTWKSIQTPEYPIEITLELPLQSSVRRIVIEFGTEDVPEDLEIWVSDHIPLPTKNVSRDPGGAGSADKGSSRSGSRDSSPDAKSGASKEKPSPASTKSSVQPPQKQELENNDNAGFYKIATLQPSSISPGKPLILELSEPLFVSRFRLRILSGNVKSGRAAVQRFSAFGTPALTVDNVKSVADIRTVLALVDAVKQSLTYPIRSRI